MGDKYRGRYVERDPEEQPHSLLTEDEVMALLDALAEAFEADGREFDREFAAEFLEGAEKAKLQWAINASVITGAGVFRIAPVPGHEDEKLCHVSFADTALRTVIDQLLPPLRPGSLRPALGDEPPASNPAPP